MTQEIFLGIIEQNNYWKVLKEINRENKILHTLEGNKDTNRLMAWITGGYDNDVEGHIVIGSDHLRINFLFESARSNTIYKDTYRLDTLSPNPEVEIDQVVRRFFFHIMRQL